MFLGQQLSIFATKLTFLLNYFNLNFFDSCHRYPSFFSFLFFVYPTCFSASTFDDESSRKGIGCEGRKNYSTKFCACRVWDRSQDSRDVRANCMKIGKLVLGPDPLQPAPYGNRTIVSARCLSIIYSRISQSTLPPFRLPRANVLCPFFKRIFLSFSFCKPEKIVIAYDPLSVKRKK